MNKHLVWETLESYYSNSKLFLCLLVLIMTDKEETPSPRRSPTPIDPILFGMLKEIKDDLKALHTRVGSIEGQQPIPLRTQREEGQPSHGFQQPNPLPSQQQIYEEARRERHQRGRRLHQNNHQPNHRTRFDHRTNMVRQEREDYSHSPTAPHFRQHDYIDDFNDDYDLDEGYEEWRRARNHRRALPPRERRDPDIDGLGRVKVKFPAFEGKCDPDAYMDWETKIEQIGRAHV